MDINDPNSPQIVHFAILAAVFALSFIGLGKGELFRRFKMLFAWLAIILLLAGAYAYWPEVRNSKFYASLVPGTPLENNGQIEFIKAEDGHFYINALVNGKNIKFMVDTGASDIVLTQKDAKKLGIDPERLEYDRVFLTANGTTHGARVKLSYLEAGSFEIKDFYASINKGELDSSLLGMAFLDKFKSYHVEHNRLILQP